MIWLIVNEDNEETIINNEDRQCGQKIQWYYWMNEIVMILASNDYYYY